MKASIEYGLVNYVTDEDGATLGRFGHPKYAIAFANLINGEHPREAFKVAQRYRARNGKTYTVDTIAPSEPYPLKSTAPCFRFAWALDGRAFHKGETEYDLIDRLPDEATDSENKIQDASNDALAEIRRARVTLGFGPMNSAHEGYAILLEEMDELKAHVWANQKKRDIAAMRAEAIQIAAMALCFAAEVCNEETGRK